LRTPRVLPIDDEDEDACARCKDYTSLCRTLVVADEVIE
jgi:hypothetical protein